MDFESERLEPEVLPTMRWLGAAVAEARVMQLDGEGYDDEAQLEGDGANAGAAVRVEADAGSGPLRVTLDRRALELVRLEALPDDVEVRVLARGADEEEGDGSERTAGNGAGPAPASNGSVDTLSVNEAARRMGLSTSRIRELTGADGGRKLPKYLAGDPLRTRGSGIDRADFEARALPHRRGETTQSGLGAERSSMDPGPGEQCISYEFMKCS